MKNEAMISHFNEKVLHRLNGFDDMSEVNAQFNKFSEAIRSSLQDFTVYSQSRKPKKNPWITNRLKNLSKKRDFLYKALAKRKDAASLERFKTFKRKFEKELRNAKRNFYRKKFYQNIGDSRQTFRTLNEVLGNKARNKSTMSRILVSGSEILCPKEIAESMNNYFINIGVQVSSAIPDTGARVRAKSNDSSMYLFPVTAAEVHRLILNLKSKSSSGFDGIPNNVVKVLDSKIVQCFTTIINNSFSSGVFPDLMKLSKVVPLFKGGNTLDPSCYRPISLLSSLSKIPE
ncbi:MAG: hypothetical protein AAGK97_18390, partial [Bacteroidota bacterium]